MVPAIMTIAFTVVLSLLVGIIHHNSVHKQKQVNDLLLERYSNVIKTNINATNNFLNLLEIEWTQGNLTEEVFQEKVTSYLTNHPELINITWANADYEIKSVSPLQGNAHIIGLKIELPQPKAASRKAVKEKHTTYTKAYEALQGGSSFEAWIPVFKQDHVLGLFAAVYSSDKVIKNWIGVENYSNTHFSLVDHENVTITEIPYEDFKNKTTNSMVALDFLDNGLKLEVKSNIETPFTLLIMIIMILLSLLVLGITYSLCVLRSTKILLLKKEVMLTHQNRDLIAAKEKAEESDRLKSAFLTNMSHEIRTPMNGILGFASLLKAPNLKGKQQQQYIDIIEKSGARMLNIINNIISISKIETGQIDVYIQELNINDKIKHIHTLLKPDTDEKKLQFIFHSALPTEEAVIRTDNEKVYTILTNLVKNAIKYSHKGTIEFGYALDDTITPSEIQFYVKDAGIGIPENRQEAIFERFIQADIKDKMAYQGAGLGLSISKAYVERLGGRIWVESEVDKGSTFYFTLPYLKKIKESIEMKTEISNRDNQNREILIA